MQIALFDDPARPDAADQLVFADDRPIGLDQRNEHIEATAAELYRPAVGKNFAAMRHDPETAELDARQRLGQGIRWLFAAYETILETPGEPAESALKDRLYHRLILPTSTTASSLPIWGRPTGSRHSRYTTASPGRAIV